MARCLGAVSASYKLVRVLGDAGAGVEPRDPASNRDIRLACFRWQQNTIQHTGGHARRILPKRSRRGAARQFLMLAICQPRSGKVGHTGGR